MLSVKIGTAVACLAPTLIFGQTKPPTLDPTYGFPLPHRHGGKPVLSPDAHWIWASRTLETQDVYARHSLTLHDTKNVQVFVTADNYFQLFVNGQKVGGTAPDPNDDLVWSKAHSYDVSSLLKSGINEIAVLATNAGGQAGLLLRVQQNGKPILLSDNSWKLTDAMPSANWSNPDFVDSSWPSAIDLGPAAMSPWGSQLAGWPADLQAIPDYLYHLSLPPKKVSYAPDIQHLTWRDANPRISIGRPAGTSGDWSVILDFGQELTGRVLVDKYKGALKIGTGESIGEAIEKPYRSSNGSPSPYSAFRYAVLSFPENLDRFDGVVKLDHLYYPVEYKGSFDCSDPLLTQIWYTGAYTAHLCMQQDIWDAPKRDRARWMGDLHVSGEVINNVFADKFLMEQTIRRLREDAQGGRPAGDLPASNVNGIPGYSCAWIAGIADLYRHIGNIEYVQEQKPAMISLLEYMRGELGPDGTFANKHGQWPFVDWSPEFNGDHPLARLATHLFFVKAVREAVFLFNELGDSANASKYSQWADELTATAQKSLASPNGAFGDRNQSNAMAIYSGVATPIQTVAIYDQILKPGSPSWSIVTSPYYNNYVIFAMSMAGHTQDATNFVRSYWGGMLAEGATTWWEGYDPSWIKDNFHAHLQADDGTGYFVSLCHGWSAAPTNFLTERVLGLRVTGGGCKTCEIVPDLGDLTWARGTLPTPKGPLKAHVERVGQGLKVVVEVPAGVTAKVSLPSSTIVVDGQRHSGSSVDLSPGKHVVSGQ